MDDATPEVHCRANANGTVWLQDRSGNLGSIDVDALWLLELVADADLRRRAAAAAEEALGHVRFVPTARPAFPAATAACP
jgi:hypothetical protein